ncbi:MAG: type I-E CRISPR-associated protein Cas7/Cse4/CasC [Planctomycetes bacterium]|nr:type I-E CRISPR-associated protein Cas7/Cse4/CasC [Planctomycetota bacterium]
MRHLELHILQSFPVSCLNRDDLNSPKTAIFGGVQRARVSSQCWKRAVREMAQEELPSLFKGQRGRLIVEPLKIALQKEGLDEKKAVEVAKEISDYLAKYDGEAETKSRVLRVKTAYFTTQAEIDKLATAYKEKGDVKKAIKEIKPEDLKDAADISLFGRMVASDHTLTLEGASMFSHALSTHKVDNEIDYFSTVEDFPNVDAGAAMTGTLEFNSATYYRFAALNFDMLFDKDHLASLNSNERKEVVKAFVKATIQAVPVARKNSMNGNVLPNYVLCVIRKKGHPVQLINAFEEPIFNKNGIVKKSVTALEEEYNTLKTSWELSSEAEIKMPKNKMSELLVEVGKHVN